MKSFPRYRIPVMIGYLLPPIISFFLAREMPYHIVVKIFLFIILMIVIYLVELGIGIKVTQIWNNRQEEKERSNHGGTD